MTSVMGDGGTAEPDQGDGGTADPDGPVTLVVTGDPVSDVTEAGLPDDVTLVDPTGVMPGDSGTGINITGPIVGLYDPSDLKPCSADASTQECNVTNFERCTLIRERTRRCTCLPGFAYDYQGSHCIGK